MGWRFRKTIKTGPFRHTITTRGIGSSIGFLGVRFGISPSGDFFFSFSIAKTGIYYIRYFRRGRGSHSKENAPSKSGTRLPSKRKNRG